MRALTLTAFIIAATPALGLTQDDIDGAAFDGGALPDGQSGLTVKLQVLLDRAGVSPGIIDGYKGGMSESAIRGFEEREGLAVDGVLDADVWSALGGDSAGAVLMDYTVTEDDAANLTESIPDNVAEKAELDALGYTSVSEKLAERFHMDEDFLKALNPDVGFAVGDTITVADVGDRLEAQVARVEVRKSTQRAVTFDADGNQISNYPVAIGSDETPSPEGTVEVTAVAMDPTYSYRPDVNFEADGVKEALTLPPGANGPVGSVWIDLSEPTYGLHGTDTPAALFQNESHGCVRFTNWDVEELAYMVSAGVTVEFIE
ncbi:L,D-transpeptidase family protein [Yoonia sp. 208BN28-4]|uniref:L,D-transpeptidase family protein n=1 Tax=Yoonia sp. 208BN28-4 TaxID=3126505 RepID=UPI0030A53E97